ncbi:MAG: hypothetical protein CUN53_00670 [Phototrophicales bacterium]|nr:MAG: hypothetical protein CUN53_00670 [Phototrophicales bacterium]
MSSRRRICILALSTIQRDARVLRQLEYLSPHYNLTVVGEGSPPPEYPDIVWIGVDRAESRRGVARLIERMSTMALIPLGRIVPRALAAWYFTRPVYSRLCRAALESRADALLANDWETLPAAAEAAARTNAKLIFDAHEFAPLEVEESAHWRFWSQPVIKHMLRRCAPRVDAAMTVCQPIAERFAQEYGFKPIVVMNAPKREPVPLHPISPDRIRLVHHGSAAPSRRLDWIIDALTLAEPRFELHFYLVGKADEVEAVQRRAQERLPERIHFHEPVKPEQITRTINVYDLGICIIPPTNYNSYVALPNKLFDYINARLGVLVGPSPAMRALVEQHHVGVVADAFTPEAIAAALNALMPESIMAMKRAADQASQSLNANIEMGKVIALFEQVLG